MARSRKRQADERLAINVSPAAAVAGVPVELSAAAELLWEERRWPVHIGLGVEARPPAVLTLVVPAQVAGRRMYLDVAAWRAVVEAFGVDEAREALANSLQEVLAVERLYARRNVYGMILTDPELAEARHRIAGELVDATMRER